MLILTCGSVLTEKKFLVMRHCGISVDHGDGQQVEAEEEDDSSIDRRRFDNKAPSLLLPLRSPDYSLRLALLFRPGIFKKNRKTSVVGA